MPVHRNAEDVWFWACTSLGRHRAAHQVPRDLPQDHREQTQRALDRFYRRQRTAPDQDRRDGHHTNIRLRREPAERPQAPLRASGLSGDGAVRPLMRYPHV
jgi:hypothetical protein